MPTTMSCLRLCQLSSNEAVLLFKMQENYYIEKDTVADVITLMMIYALVNCILGATESCIITTLLLWKCTAKISPKSLLPFSNLRAYYSWLCKTNCICRRTYYVNVCQVKYTIFMYIVLTKLLKREQIIIGNRKYGFGIYCHQVGTLHGEK